MMLIGGYSDFAATRASGSGIPSGFWHPRPPQGMALSLVIWISDAHLHQPGRHRPALTLFGIGLSAFVRYDLAGLPVDRWSRSTFPY